MRLPGARRICSQKSIAIAPADAPATEVAIGEINHDLPELRTAILAALATGRPGTPAPKHQTGAA